MSKLQNEDFKTLAQITGAGGSASQLLNDTKIYVSASGLNKQLSAAIADGDIGGGGGGKNYIANDGAEADTSGWATYADTGAQPVDGTGGSPNVTWTRTTTNPLAGVGSFLFTKDAANRQGQGVSYDFTVDRSDEGSILTCPFVMQPRTGTYSGGTSTTDSDLTVYIVSKEFGTVIQPSFYKLQGAVNDKVFKAVPVFQVPVSAGGANAREFRFCIHVATTSASAYTVAFDEFKVTPISQGIVPIQSDWSNVTSNVTVSSGFGTVTNKEIYMRRDGDTMFLRGTFRSGTVTGSSAYIELPFGLKADSSKTNWGIAFASLGRWQTSTLATTAFSVDGSLANVQGMCTVYDPNPERLVFAFRGTGYGFQNPSVSSIMAGGEAISFEATIPIQGWGSSVAVSPDTTSGRLVDLKYARGSSQSIPYNTWTDMLYDTKQSDTHAIFNTSTGEATIGEPGDYFIVAGAYFTGLTASSGQTLVRVMKNGSEAGIGDARSIGVSTEEGPVAVGLLPNLVAGDVIKVQSFQNNTASLSRNAGGSIQIFKVSNQAQIGPGEPILARAYTTTAGSYNSGDNIVWDGKSYDTHNAFSIATGKFTAPAPGMYSVKAQIRFQAGSNTQGDSPSFILEKNDSDYSILDNYLIPYTGSFILFFSGNSTIQMNAGDTCNVYAAGYGGSRALSTNFGLNYIEIERVG